MARRVRFWRVGLGGVSPSLSRGLVPPDFPPFFDGVADGDHLGWCRFGFQALMKGCVRSHGMETSKRDDEHVVCSVHGLCAWSHARFDWVSQRPFHSSVNNKLEDGNVDALRPFDGS